MSTLAFPIDPSGIRSARHPAPAAAAGTRPASAGDADAADLRPLLRRGFAILALGLGGFLAFAAWAPVDQALPGSGLVSVAGQRKAIQHAAGGRVVALAVKEGDVVEEGQVLLALDVEAPRAELASVQQQLLSAQAGRVRLAALLAGRSQLVFGDELERRAAATERGRSLLQTQAELFASQRLGLDQVRSQDGARAAQLRTEAAGHADALVQRQAQRSIVEGQADQLEDLTRQGFYPRLRLMDLQRQVAAARQDEQQTATALQRTRQALAEAGHSQALRVTEQRRSWETELLETERQTTLLTARAVALSQQIAQAELRAPVAGSVVGLAAHTVGGVIAAGQTVMELVPGDGGLVVDARFELTAGEKLRAGQPADLHLTTVDRGRTPVLQGRVLTVSADRLEDARSGHPYLRVQVAVPAEERARLQASGTDLRPGLPVEVMVKLGERTLLAYLVKPLRDSLVPAFTE